MSFGEDTMGAILDDDVRTLVGFDGRWQSADCSQSRTTWWLNSSDRPAISPDLTDRDVVASVRDDGVEGAYQPIVIRSADVDVVVDDRLKTVIEVLVNHVEIV